MDINKCKYAFLIVSVFQLYPRTIKKMDAELLQDNIP